MALVIRKISRPTLIICSVRCLTVILLAWPGLSYAGVGETKHNLYKHDKEKNCALCHAPHSGKTKPALWMSENKAQIITKFGTETQNEEILCLSCHDGVMASDMYIDKTLDPENTEEMLTLPLDMRYYRIVLLSYNVCEKHYHLLSQYQDQFPKEEIKCSLCHDIHSLKLSYKNLISKKTIKKHKVCLECH